MRLIWFFIKSAFYVAIGACLLGALQACPGWTLPPPLPLVFRGCSTWAVLASDPEAISNFLSALAQIAAIPATLALGIIVLVIQLQAGSLTSRAGAVVINSPQFLFTAALLLLAPVYCVSLLGILDMRQSEATIVQRILASTATVPVAMTFVFLARFTNTWFRLVSPAAFTGQMYVQAAQGFMKHDRDSVALAVRGLGEALNNLARSADYSGLRLCATQIGDLLPNYLKHSKANLPTEFFYYQWPDRKFSPVWVEQELCDSMKDAADALMIRGAPAPTVIYIAERLVSFGQQAIEQQDIDAIWVLANTFIEMGATEKVFMSAINFNPSPLQEAANLVANNIGQPNKAQAVEIMAATFFLLFAHMHFYASQRSMTSSAHETVAQHLKRAGVDFTAVARFSEQSFAGYWSYRLPPNMATQALHRIRQL